MNRTWRPFRLFDGMGACIWEAKEEGGHAKQTLKDGRRHAFFVMRNAKRMKKDVSKPL